MPVYIEKLVIKRLVKVDDFILYIAHLVFLIHFFALFAIVIGGFPAPSEIYGYAVAVDVGWQCIIVIGYPSLRHPKSFVVKVNAAIELVNATKGEFAKCAVIPRAIAKQRKSDTRRGRCNGYRMPNVVAVAIERIEQNNGCYGDKAHEEWAQHNHHEQQKRRCQCRSQLVLPEQCVSNGACKESRKRYRKRLGENQVAIKKQHWAERISRSDEQCNATANA